MGDVKESKQSGCKIYVKQSAGAKTTKRPYAGLVKIRTKPLHPSL